MELNITALAAALSPWGYVGAAALVVIVLAWLYFRKKGDVVVTDEEDPLA